jgi:hypothetical protein
VRDQQEASIATDGGTAGMSRWPNLGERRTMNWLTETSKALAHGLGEFSPSCRQATRLQSQALDRKLNVSQSVGLRIHLLLCKWCRRYGAHLRFLREARKRTSPDHELPVAGMPPEVRERIRRKLEEAGE